MTDRISYEEKKNFQIQYSDFPSAASTPCPTPPMCVLPKHISAIVPKNSNRALPVP